VYSKKRARPVPKEQDIGIASLGKKTQYFTQFFNKPRPSISPTSRNSCCVSQKQRPDWISSPTLNGFSANTEVFPHSLFIQEMVIQCIIDIEHIRRRRYYYVSRFERDLAPLRASFSGRLGILGNIAVAVNRKHDIITFKVDDSLRQAMVNIPNRSEFIRAAILAALDSVCPLCKGTGILTPDQRTHWNQFLQHHTVEECEDCHAVHLVCEATGAHEHSLEEKPRESE
jgi:hypothetical protein